MRQQQKINEDGHPTQLLHKVWLHFIHEHKIKSVVIK